MTADALSLPRPKQKRRPDIFTPRERLTLTIVYGSLAAALIYGFVRVYQALEVSRGLAGAHLRVDLRPLLHSGLVIQTHVAGALASFVLGMVIMLQPKGSRMHRQLGWAWVATMAVASIASIFIQTSGGFSWIHGFTAVTLLLLPIGVASARAHKAKMHARYMTGLFLGGMIGAGLFTFLPGRIMWDVLFAV